MKTIRQYFIPLMLLACLASSPPVCPAQDNTGAKKAAVSILAPHQNRETQVAHSPLSQGYNPLSSSIAFATNLWTQKLYSIDVLNPASITVIAPAPYNAFCSDFLPGDTQHMWIINYLTNTLEKVDITTGLSVVVAPFPNPLAATGGVWSCLSIHKTTGEFYAIATDGNQSILYHFNAATGAILSSFNLDILAAISSTFDYSGAMYMLDIASDSIYTINVNTGAVTPVGHAGFDSDYAQGMGYDPVGNEIYLAAYSAAGGAQLRRLDRATGNTNFQANLPGSTAAFSFPVQYYAPYANAGADAVISWNQGWNLADAYAGNYSSLTWSTGGDGSFSGTTILHPTYLPGSADIAAGAVQLCLTAWPQGPGMDSVVDCMTLTVTSIPSGLDFGDAPENEWPNIFPTTLVNDGAAHVINPNIHLGLHIDGELDGQPNTLANGDDTGVFFPSPYDDEDGVTLPASIPAGSIVSISVVASVAGYLDAWMDFDGDMTWLAPDENIFSIQPLSAGSNALTFMVPAVAAPGQSWLRFRFRDYSEPLLPNGLAYNGEVEDYPMTITANAMTGFDFGDAPQGDGTHSYPTLLSSNGARHQYVPGIHLGTYVDVESDGQPNATSSGDDNDTLYTSLGDDEDGVIFPSTVTPGSILHLAVNASVDGYLTAWMDFNRNGNWSDAGEKIFSAKPVAAGWNYLTFTVAPTAVSGNTYMRFRFCDYDEVLSFNGVATNGEVEDYSIQVLTVPTLGWDWGDAPDGGAGAFPTLLSSNGARHVIVPGVFLGTMVDAEPDGQPGNDSFGDDMDFLYPASGDDEDGVVFNGPLYSGQTASITVTASTAGYLDGWIDFNGDGTWSSAFEHIFTSNALAAGSTVLTFPITPGANTGPSYARFRFRTSSTPLNYFGLAENGEVEDYRITIWNGTLPAMDFGDAPEEPGAYTYSFQTTLANNGASHLIVPGVYLGNGIDAEPDGQPSPTANGDDINGISDDENGVEIPDSVTQGSTVTIIVTASVPGFLCAWMDFDLDHTWLDPAEHIFMLRPLNAGTNTLTFVVPCTAAAGRSIARFRFHTDSIPLLSDGFASNGEVEDYPTILKPILYPGMDYGDAPAPYPTLLTNNGAQHAVTCTTYLGSKIDMEYFGNPSVLADGDDGNNQDDEDGIVFLDALITGTITRVQVTASCAGILNGWIDFYANGNWSDAVDHVFANLSLAPGLNTLLMPVPVNAVTGYTYARFRFSTQAGLTYTGAANDGEVEDYRVSIQPFTTDFSDIWMKDTPTDTGVEPNPDNGPMWISEDIWVRNKDDGGTVHQWPIYNSPCGTGHSNEIYVTVRNRGTLATPGNEELKIYWAMTSTGLDWNNDWLNNEPYGGEITNNSASLYTQLFIPPIPPGGSVVMKTMWCSPNPANYPGLNPNRLHIGLLARIIGITGDFYDNIRFVEWSSTNLNVKNNNNIIMRNTSLREPFPFSGDFFIKNPIFPVAQWKLSFITPGVELNDHFFNYGYVKMDLGPDLYQAWVAGGSAADGIDLDTGNVIRLLTPQSWIGNIGPMVNPINHVKYEFVMQTQPVPSARNQFNLDVVQYLQMEDHDSLLSGFRIGANTNCPLPVINGPSTICPGNTALLVAVDQNNVAVQYQWLRNGVILSGETNDSLSINGIDNYSIVMTDGKGCSKTASRNVTSDPLLPVSVSIVASANPVCTGTQVTFTASPINGGSTPVYQWILNGNIIPGSTSSSYTYLPSDADVITSVLTSNEGCVTGNPATSNAIAIIVNPGLPLGVTIAASANPVCAGTSVTYTATVTNGSSNYATIGNGNTPVGYPYYTHWMGSRTQLLYTATQLSAAGAVAGSIDKIGFQVGSVSSQTMTQFNVKMGLTTASALSGFVSGLSTVYGTTYTVPGNAWRDITLTTPFIWDGVSNVIVEVCFGDNGTYTVNSFVYGNASSGTTWNYHDDFYSGCSGTAVGSSQTILPNIRFHGASGDVYQWKVNGLNAGTNSSIFSYIPLNNDVVTCVVTTLAQCRSNNPATSPPVTMVLNPMPSAVIITPSAPVISQGSVQPLNASGGTVPGGSVFTWMPVTDLYTDAAATVPYNGQPLANVFSKPSATITYTVSATSTAGCITAGIVTVTVTTGIPVQVNLSNLNVVAGQTFCSNATQTITLAGASTTVIVESTGSMTLIAGQNVICLPLTRVYPGGYLHAYIAPLGPWCGAKSASLVENTAETSEISPVSDRSFFNLFPNPTTGGFSIELKGHNESSELRVEIYNMHGERLFSEQLKGRKKYDFSLADKPNGVYFIQVVTGKYAGTGKIIKQ